MGKKGTKRKTKWRTLTLGEEAGGSGNEEEMHDEDQSTTSSLAGQPTITYKPQPPYYKTGEKCFKPNRRLSYERYKKKEPLVKLESKTFDEEEYTKITTPRQDVLFKKGYFGRKRESSVEETTHYIEETEGEEPMMDQIIITNGFVDERGHYLVNGNSYEIYDPYSNTVTVVVGPPPYTNGVTQPVLAAVSCQPVPLQPVDWYPPGSDWPSQGSAWTPSYPRNPQTDSALSPVHSAENVANFHGGSEGSHAIPNIYQQSPYVVPGYVYSDSSVYNGEPVQRNPRHHTTENLCSYESNRSRNIIDTSTKNCQEASDRKDVKEQSKPMDEKLNERTEEENKSQNACVESPKFAQNSSETNGKFDGAEENPGSTTNGSNLKSCESEAVMEEPEKRDILRVTDAAEVSSNAECEKEEKRVEKQSHSTQTTSTETDLKIFYPRSDVPYKESHSTQTPPEDQILRTNGADAIQKENEKNNGRKSDVETFRNMLDVQLKQQPAKVKFCWKSNQQQGHEYDHFKQNKEIQRNSSNKKCQEESPRRIYQQRTNFVEDKKLKVENEEQAGLNAEGSPIKISYAKKAMAGLETANDWSSKVVNGFMPTTYNNNNNNINKTQNGLKNAQNNLLNGKNRLTTTANGIRRTGYLKQASTERHGGHDEKKSANGNAQGGVFKPRYNNKNFNGNKSKSSEQISEQDYRRQQQAGNPKEYRFREKTVLPLGKSSSDSNPPKTPSESSKDKSEETVSDSTNTSEKSSTVSELSSPTELSSGQNTPPEKIIVRKMEEKIANEINKSFEEKLKRNLTKKNEREEKEREREAAKMDDKEKKGTVSVGKGKTEGKKKSNGNNNSNNNNNNSNSNSNCNDNYYNNNSSNGKANSNNKGRGENTERIRETNKTNSKKRKKKISEEMKENVGESNAAFDENSFLPNLILQEPNDLIFRTWKEMKGEEVDMISKMDATLTEDDKILKTLGLNEGKMNFSKLPLHSDLLVMVPAFGWTRPKFTIEDMFASTKQLHHDLFTRRNIANMKSTKPEEFFASVVDGPIVEKTGKTKKEGNGKSKKKEQQQQQQQQVQGKATEEPASDKGQLGKESKSANVSSGGKKSGSPSKMPIKTNKSASKSSRTIKEDDDNMKKANGEVSEKKFGIVEAVNTWLQEQEHPKNVLSVDRVRAEAEEEGEDDEGVEGEKKKEEKTENSSTEAKAETEDDSIQKNGVSNPMHASSRDGKPETESAAENFPTNDGCIRVADVINDSFVRKGDRKQRSSSLDEKLSKKSRAKKPSKFSTDSPSLCQDLISDKRNGLETKCDRHPEESLLECYKNSSWLQNTRGEFEYKFSAGKESDRVDRGLVVERKGKESVADSGVHSDDNSPEKDVTCKLQ